MFLCKSHLFSVLLLTLKYCDIYSTLLSFFCLTEVMGNLITHNPWLSNKCLNRLGVGVSRTELREFFPARSFCEPGKLTTLRFTVACFHYDQESISPFLPFSRSLTNEHAVRDIRRLAKKGKYSFAVFVTEPAPTNRGIVPRTQPIREHFA